MLHVVTTGAYYPPVVTTWKNFTKVASYLTMGTFCNELRGHECDKRQTFADAKIFELRSEQDFLFCILCHLEDDAARNKPVLE